MRLKDKVSFDGIKSTLALGLLKAETVHRQFSREEMVVTSLNDGDHGGRSLHYKGLAADLRFWYIVAAERAGFAEALQTRLGSDWDVVLEKDHVHLEFQPKG